MLSSVIVCDKEYYSQFSSTETYEDFESRIIEVSVFSQTATLNTVLIFVGAIEAFCLKSDEAVSGLLK